MRLFIAIELDAPGKRAIGKLIEKLGRPPGKIRWVGPEQMHLTLNFLGDTPAERIPEIAQAMARAGAAAGSGSISFRLEGLGGFPDLRQPRVIWVGIIEPTGALLRLQAALTEELAELGVKGEDRAFAPHLTLGRSKQLDRGTDYERLFAPRRDFVGPEQLAEKMLLISSELGPDGPTYTTVATAPL